MESSHYSLADACWDIRHCFGKWNDVDVEYGIADPKKGMIPETPDDEEHEDDWQPEPNVHLYATGTFEYGEEHTLTISKGPAPTWPTETIAEVKEPGTAIATAVAGGDQEQPQGGAVAAAPSATTQTTVAQSAPPAQYPSPSSRLPSAVYCITRTSQEHHEDDEEDRGLCTQDVYVSLFDANRRAREEFLEMCDLPDSYAEEEDDVFGGPNEVEEKNRGSRSVPYIGQAYQVHDDLYMGRIEVSKLRLHQSTEKGREEAEQSEKRGGKRSGDAVASAAGPSKKIRPVAAGSVIDLCGSSP